jgi:fucose permease
MADEVPDPGVAHGVRATYIAFGAAGFAFASWASRIPQVRDTLAVDPAELGLILLAIAVGSLIALPLAGTMVSHFGSARTVAATSVALAVALAIVALGYLHGVLPVLLGLFILGFGNGAWDVAMNVQGAVVERRLGRSIMPRFHAGYSLGTVAGALLGALMIGLGVPVTAHLLGVSVLIAAVVPLATRRFVPDVTDPVEGAHTLSKRRSALAGWLEPRTLLIGVVVLCFAFVEGTGNDWIGIAVIDGYDVDPAVGSLGFAAFLVAMTAGRWVGPGVLDRFGRVPTVRVLAAVGTIGLVVFVFAPTLPLAFVGVVLWGIGASLGFPVGMSAAADEPVRAASRVSVVASIGYFAFLGGPPLIGFLGDHYGVQRALIVAAGLLALATMLAAALRPVDGAMGGNSDS